VDEIVIHHTYTNDAAPHREDGTLQPHTYVDTDDVTPHRVDGT
jgi:hypothetical protein